MPRSNGIIFPRLRAEMAREKLGIQEIATQVGMNRSTASQKLSGKYDFWLSEALKIGELFPDVELKALFQKE